MIIYLNAELAIKYDVPAGAHRRKYLGQDQPLSICTCMNLLGAAIVGILLHSSIAHYFNIDSAIMTMINAKLIKTFGPYS